MSFINKFYNVCRYMITIAVWVTMNLQITHSYSAIYSSGGWWRIVSSITNISHLWIWTEYSVRMYYLSVCPPLLISLFSVWPITRTYFSLNICVKFESAMNDIPPPRSYYTILQWQLALFSPCGASPFEEHQFKGTGLFEHWLESIRISICMSYRHWGS